MSAKAKTPERVFDKIEECRFFIAQAAGYELAQETEKFLHCLSAFMSGFRTIHNRLCGVTENKYGVETKEDLLKKLESHADISFLIKCSNIEVHEDGVIVHPRYRIHASDALSDRWKSKFEPTQSKWASRFKLRFGGKSEAANSWGTRRMPLGCAAMRSTQSSNIRVKLVCNLAHAASSQ